MSQKPRPLVSDAAALILINVKLKYDCYLIEVVSVPQAHGGAKDGCRPARPARGVTVDRRAPARCPVPLARRAPSTTPLETGACNRRGRRLILHRHRACRRRWRSSAIAGRAAADRARA